MEPSELATGAIGGRVLTRQGLPLADAVVMITGDSPSHNDIAALTSDTGEFRFTRLAPGTYTLLVTAEGYAPQQSRVDVATGQESQVEFVL